MAFVIREKRILKENATFLYCLKKRLRGKERTLNINYELQTVLHGHKYVDCVGCEL